MMRVLVIAPEAPGLARLAWLDEVSEMRGVAGVELDFLGGREATTGRVSEALRQGPCDVVIWSGHGGPNRLVLGDGRVIDGEWLAWQVRQAAPVAVVLAACLSGPHDEALQSMAEAISQAGISTVGMWVSVEDRAATVYSVEFVRALSAGANVAVAHRVAGRMMAALHPQMAGAAFLLPGLVNGYGALDSRLARLEARLAGLEARLEWIGGLLVKGEKA